MPRLKKSSRNSRKTSRKYVRQTRKKRSKSNRKSRFGIINPSEYELHRRMKKLTGHFENACLECEDEWKTYSQTIGSGLKYKPERTSWMKELCVDCAEINCSTVVRAKKLGISVPTSELENCKKSLTIAERAKKIK
jgi:hypothetical protein